MKCRSLTAIVLAVAMLVSFGLCNLSVAAETEKLFHETGTVYDNNVHVPLGNYNNWIDETVYSYGIAYHCETFPPSQLVGTSTYQTYFINNAFDEKIVDITQPISAIGGNGTQAIVEGVDINPKYEILSNEFPGLGFRCVFTNKIESASGNAYYGERVNGVWFVFQNG